MPSKSRRKRQSEEADMLGREAQKRMRNESEIQDDNEATTSSAIPLMSLRTQKQCLQHHLRS